MDNMKTVFVLLIYLRLGSLNGDPCNGSVQPKVIKNTGANHLVVTPPSGLQLCHPPSVWLCRRQVQGSISEQCSSVLEAASSDDSSATPRFKSVAASINVTGCDWIYTGLHVSGVDVTRIDSRVSGIYKINWGICVNENITCPSSLLFVSRGVELSSWIADVSLEGIKADGLLKVRIQQQRDKCSSQFYFNQLSLIIKIYLNYSSGSVLFDAANIPILTMKRQVSYNKTHGASYDDILSDPYLDLTKLGYSVEIRPSNISLLCKSSIDSLLSPCPNIIKVHKPLAKVSDSIMVEREDKNVTSLPYVLVVVLVVLFFIVSAILVTVPYLRRRLTVWLQPAKPVTHQQSVPESEAKSSLNNSALYVLLLCDFDDEVVARMREVVFAYLISKGIHVYTVKHPDILCLLLRLPSPGDLLLSSQFLDFKLVLIAPERPDFISDLSQEKCQSIKFSSPSIETTENSTTSSHGPYNNKYHTTVESQMILFIQKCEVLRIDYQKVFVVTKNGRAPSGLWSLLTPARVFSGQDLDALVKHMLGTSIEKIST